MGFVIIFLLGLFAGMVVMIVLLQIQKSHIPEQKAKELVDELLRLEKTIGVIPKLQYDKMCKEELADIVHGLFFFRELKEPEAFYNRLATKMQHFSDGIPEEQALKKMYQSILDEIRLEWLND